MATAEGHCITPARTGPICIYDLLRIHHKILNIHRLKIVEYPSQDCENTWKEYLNIKILNIHHMILNIHCKIRKYTRFSKTVWNAIFKQFALLSSLTKFSSPDFDQSKHWARRSRNWQHHSRVWWLSSV